MLEKHQNHRGLGGLVAVHLTCQLCQPNEKRKPGVHSAKVRFIWLCHQQRQSQGCVYTHTQALLFQMAM